MADALGVGSVAVRNETHDTAVAARAGSDRTTESLDGVRARRRRGGPEVLGLRAREVQFERQTERRRQVDPDGTASDVNG